MTARGLAILLAMCACTASASAASAPRPADPRLRELTFDPGTVVSIPVKRGVVTLIVLDPDEVITEVASGLGGDCSKAEAAWCVAAQAGGRTLFVKPKSSAGPPNNLAVVTDRRLHALRFDVLADNDPRQPVHRLSIKAPPARQTAATRLAQQLAQALKALPVVPPSPSPQEQLASRLQAKPQLRNSNYSMAEGPGSDDIVPTLVFDDGRFTYLRFAGNREVPAVFNVWGDGSETLVNTRMEDDLLVVDRISRRLMLRAGPAVVAVWNEAFELDGVAPEGGATVPGVQRLLKAGADRLPNPVTEPSHD